ncbi:hypothetical protein RJ640_008216 [Escallonia rubra]|uniref:Fungal lipase-type domain-containing protein n=1 Tax=Escallonia rubra TaxID=112253 RepID=A0AA88QGW3_9ASTE|nr:hypothetical protein RJ640_008216 [Escallonia rubra]
MDASSPQGLPHHGLRRQRHLGLRHGRRVCPCPPRLPPHPRRLRGRPLQPTVPHGGYRLNPNWVVKRVTYEQTSGHAPRYLIDVDHEHREIVLAIRGLNLVKESDYKLLLDNALGMQMFDGGYVHHGLLKSAIWLLNQESNTLKRLWVENGSDYKMVFAGHSLGSGVAALLTASSGNAVSGSIAGPHVVPTRSVPRPMHMGGMQRMQPQGMTAYNLASQAGMGAGMNPASVPMQRGVTPQAHQQQQLRRKDPGMGMTGYPPQQRSRRF